MSFIFDINEHLLPAKKAAVSFSRAHCTSYLEERLQNDRTIESQGDTYTQQNGTKL